MTSRKEKSDSLNSDKGNLGGIVRELALSGLATFFMTEDSVRKYLKDLKLPKELASFLLESINKRKADFYGLVAKEVGQVVARVNIEQEVGKFLEKHDVHVNATFSFEPKMTAKKEKKGS